MATPTSLPASFTAGQVLTAAEQNALRGAFRVLQVVHATNSTSAINNTNTYADTGLSATITPQSVDSKILVLVNHPSCDKSAADSNNGIKMQLLRGASVIATFASDTGFTATAMRMFFGISSSYFDSPASIAALTYKTQFANRVNTASVVVQASSIASTITLLEISA
jgi:hypothetical protein